MANHTLVKPHLPVVRAAVYVVHVAVMTAARLRSPLRSTVVSMDRIWRGGRWGLLEGLAFAAVALGVNAEHGKWWGIGVLAAGLLAHVVFVAYWLFARRPKRAARPPVEVTPPPEVDQQPVETTPLKEFRQAPAWGFGPTQPPSSRLDPEIVKAVVEASRLGHVVRYPISPAEMHAVAVKCQRQGQEVQQIARTLVCRQRTVEHLLSDAVTQGVLAVTR